MTDLRHAKMSRAQFFRMMGGLAAAAAAAGCSTKPQTGGTTGASGAAALDLKFVGVADQKTPMDELAAAYRQARAGVTITTSYAPTDQVQTSLRTQLGAGNAPDLHVVYPGSGSAMSMTQIAGAGLLADLSAQAWTKTIPTGFKPAFQLDGKTLMYSAGSSVIGAIYNKKVFQEAGIDAPPTTWTEFLGLCEKLKKAGKVPIALGAQTPWVTQLITYALVPSTVYAKDPTFDDKQAAGQASFAQSGWRDAMEMYLELQKRGYFNDKPNGTTFEQQTSMVATGKAAMAIQVSAVLPSFRDAASSPDDLSMFPLPGADDAASVWIPAGVVVGLGANAKGKNAEEAKAFIDFLGRQENINRWAKAIAAIPLTQDASSTIDPAVESFLPFTKDRAVPFMDQRWPNAEVQPTHFAVVQDLLAGKSKVDEALKKMDEAYAK
ncbi:extracellular solute-binding protein [Streptosporangium roseum]|uniref:ABC-type sugar transport system periplasmic component-like protein n=1 Tax=Streptosporangium roseum (strain ATCC 12428 / DSM 43021 / JCM 3005 / KCTC 9067 / NCIMB 10171 / NRRL 2505 / NI 9100) TaxID=479432 RepID=D2AYU8_STRRD|nr:extracellular solute-binding protein [Streptosporangium roseum]ACZ90885.1 ABC-type sugar transport system periplasmic component-like protein [Streptosporangium roseum DSM 43021]